MVLIPKTRFSNIHMIGIGGSGMSGIAEILHNLGFNVRGSDTSKKETTERLEKLGVKVFYGHKAENVEGADIVVYSSAITPDNPELIRAKELGIPVIQRAEMLAELMRVKFSIAVSGAHGKSTTTSMIGHILQRANKNPTVIVGGILRDRGSGSLMGSGEYLVVEADESDRSFLKLLPSIAIITNIDREHMDTYGSMASLKMAFIEFANKVPFYGSVILCGDDKNTRDIIPFIEKRFFTYGFSGENDIFVEDLKVEGLGSEFVVKGFGERVLGKLNVPGKYNVLNAMASIIAAWELGISLRESLEYLVDFKGVGRRFEIKGEKLGATFVDDYGHHPTEIMGVIEVAKGMGKRVVMVFQPHRYTRTMDLHGEFANVLKEADFVILLPIYPAGERPISGVSSELIYKALKSLGYENVVMVGDFDEAVDTLRKVVREGDIVLLQGAGDVYKIYEKV
ncbi:MAG: UDP-N-acetylmuramate--L-alanine ligase [candidate division WOR-3 bacterium]